MAEGDQKRLVEDARDEARAIRSRVEKHRSDPTNYFTTHALLDVEEHDAEWYEAVARTLEESAERLAAYAAILDFYGHLVEANKLYEKNRKDR